MDEDRDIWSTEDDLRNEEKRKPKEERQRKPSPLKEGWWKRGLVYVGVIIASILFIYFGNKIASEGLSIFRVQESSVNQVSATVEKVINDREEDVSLGGVNSGMSRTIEFQGRFTKGDLEGSIFNGVQKMESYIPVHPKIVEPGDNILVYQMDGGAANTWAFQEYIRTDAIIILGIVFGVLLIIFGRFKGLNTIISLVFTCLAIFLVFVPSILTGHNIYLWGIMISVFVIIMTLLLVNGPNRKSLAAGIGCFGGLLVAGILIVIMDKILFLTGVLDEESIYLLQIGGDSLINLRGIIFASVIIGALGAILDVSVSIASSLTEIREAACREMSFSEYVKSGMNIGRDIMGTMVNTLVLAYIGSALSVVLLLIVYSSSLEALLNREMIIVEILQSLIGSMGLLFTIPLTSIACGFIYTRFKNRKDKIKGPEISD